jgi:hypothetical protein
MLALLLIVAGVIVARILGWAVLRLMGTQCTTPLEDTIYGTLLLCAGGALAGVWLTLDVIVGGI